MLYYPENLSQIVNEPYKNKLFILLILLNLLNIFIKIQKNNNFKFPTDQFDLQNILINHCKIIILNLQFTKLV